MNQMTHRTQLSCPFYTLLSHAPHIGRNLWPHPCRTQWSKEDQRKASTMLLLAQHRCRHHSPHPELPLVSNVPKLGTSDTVSHHLQPIGVDQWVHTNSFGPLKTSPTRKKYVLCIQTPSPSMSRSFPCPTRKPSPTPLQFLTTGSAALAH